MCDNFIYLFHFTKCNTNSKCVVPCWGYTSPLNKCVFKCFLQSIQATKGRFQINRQNIPTTGTIHSKRSHDPVSLMIRYNNVTMSNSFQTPSRSTRHQRSSNTTVGNISRVQNMQAFKHNHNHKKFLCVESMDGHCKSIRAGKRRQIEPL